VDLAYIAEAGNDFIDALDEGSAHNRCRCSEELPTEMKTRIKSRQKLTEVQEIKLLTTWYRLAGPRGDQCNICYTHTRQVAQKCGLITNTLTYRSLVERLRRIYVNLKELGDLKVRDDTFFWF
jgi:hypothetical protein